MKQTLTLMTLIMALNLPPSYELSSSADVAPEAMVASSLQHIITEAKQMVDQAYKFSRDRTKENLKKVHTPSDFLKHLKEPVAGTRTAIRAADYMETILNLLSAKMDKLFHKHLNVTDLLTSRQKDMLSQVTGCNNQIRQITCLEDSPYRTITGECNNRLHPHFGTANHGFSRWLPAEYEDGMFLPKGFNPGHRYHGHLLPLVRQISREIAATSNKDSTKDNGRSLAFMHWGQWVNHDLDLAPSAVTGMNKTTCDTSCDYYVAHCFPIKIPAGDPRREKQGPCMPFTRSAKACNPKSFVRQQINAVTSFLDASMVYGSEAPLARCLQNQSNDLGLMAINQNFTDHDGLALMPFENNSNSFCLFNKTANIPCFKAGDTRANENMGLMALHTLFLREHNRLARELKTLNPQWDGEKLYQEARKIIGALIQITTYRDYLPLVLGNEMNKQLPLYRGYKSSVDPTIANVFSLALRFGHGSIPPLVPRLDENFKPLLPYSHVPLHRTFGATWRIIMEGGIEPLLRGFLADSSKLMKQNQMMVAELQERLFEQLHRDSIGLDLASLNLQRGRDHGLPGYNAWRRFCSLSAPSNEAELAAVMENPELAKKFIDLYGTPENIDIWIGGIAEPFVPNGRVGPLLACLLGTQFRKLRDGDRFWWENRGVFTVRQRRALDRDSLSRMICDNTHIKEVVSDVFKSNQYPSDFVKCQKISPLDLSAWRE